MKFAEFLKDIAGSEFWTGAHSIAFVGEEYSPVFFSKVLEILAHSSIFSSKIEHISHDEHSAESLKAMLGQSVLGGGGVYFLGDVAAVERTEKKRSELFVFLKNYQGPHRIVWFSSSKVAAHIPLVHVELEALVNEKLFYTLAQVFGVAFSPAKEALITSLFSSAGGSLALDSAVRMLDYIQLISIRKEDRGEVAAYLHKLAPSKVSLFNLSDYFFSGKDRQFFALWSVVSSEYPDLFWISYWSDQMWRAHGTVAALAQGDATKARVASARLPFSFLRQHARRYSASYFIRAHSFLYEADYALKTGSSFCALDLFFAHHFSGFFDKS
jgi:hypothetical protein